MSWETFDWKPADGTSLGAGASILPLWPMLRSAIAEAISADAMCPVTVGELAVGHIDFAELPLRPGAVAFLRAARHRPARRLGRRSIRPRATRSAATSTPPRASQELVLEGMDTAFESLLGEGLGLGASDRHLGSQRADAPAASADHVGGQRGADRHLDLR